MVVGERKGERNAAYFNPLSALSPAPRPNPLPAVCFQNGDTLRTSVRLPKKRLLCRLAQRRLQETSLFIEDQNIRNTQGRYSLGYIEIAKKSSFSLQAIFDILSRVSEKFFPRSMRTLREINTHDEDRKNYSPVLVLGLCARFGLLSFTKRNEMRI